MKEEILTGDDIAALRPFGDNGFRVGDRFYTVREMLDAIASAAAERDELRARIEKVRGLKSAADKRCKLLDGSDAPSSGQDWAGGEREGLRKALAALTTTAAQEATK